MEHWEVLTDNGWQAFDDRLDSQLKAAYERGEKSSEFNRDKWTYRVTFLGHCEAEQLNTATKAKRRVRLSFAASVPRVPEARECLLPFSSRYQIYLDNGWKTMPPQQVHEIEGHLAKNELVFEITARGFRYRIDMQNFQQVNLRTNMIRSIRKVQAMTAAPVASTAELVHSFNELFRRLSEHTGQVECAAVLSRLEAQLVSPDGWEAAQRRIVLREELLSLFRRISMFQLESVSCVEWIHYWQLVEQAPNFVSVSILQDALSQALKPFGLSNASPQVRASGGPPGRSKHGQICCLEQKTLHVVVQCNLGQLW